MRCFQAWRCALHTPAMAVVLVTFVICPVGAATSNWITDAGGNFSDPANWDNGVPGAAGTATFSRPGADYAVAVTGAVVIKQLHIDGNIVTLRPSSDGATLTVTDTTTQPSSPDGVVIGVPLGKSATLTSYLPKFSAGTLVVSQGSDGGCALNVNGGSMSCVTAEAPAMNSSGTALVSVNGADTSFNVSGSFSLGLSGNGTLGIAGGATMNSGDARLGGFSGFANATIDGAGTSWNVTGSLSVNGPAIGSSSSLTISNGARVAAGGFGIGRAGQLRIVNGGMLNSQNAGIENDSIDRPSKIVVDGDGSIWNIETFLRFGPSRSTAELDVTGGGTVIVGGNATVIAGSADDTRGTASILVDGPKSTFAIGQTLQLGGNSGGTLTVSNGANVSSGSAIIYPKNFKIPGTALVTGAGSKWTTSGDFILDGLLTVSSSGKVNVGGLMIIQDGGELHGNGTVTGNVQNGVLVAPGTSPGRLTIAGNYSQLSTGALQIELAGIRPGADYDQLSVTGNASVDGKLQVSLLNSFAPKLGDSFDILDWGTLSGTFSTLQLPVLGGNLAWDTSQLYTTGVISVTTVPEPAAVVLLALAAPALVAVALRRRNSTISKPAP